MANRFSRPIVDGLEETPGRIAADGLLHVVIELARVEGSMLDSEWLAAR